MGRGENVLRRTLDWDRISSFDGLEDLRALKGKRVMQTTKVKYIDDTQDEHDGKHSMFTMARQYHETCQRGQWLLKCTPPRSSDPSKQPGKG